MFRWLFTEFFSDTVYTTIQLQSCLHNDNFPKDIIIWNIGKTVNILIISVHHQRAHMTSNHHLWMVFIFDYIFPHFQNEIMQRWRESHVRRWRDCVIYTNKKKNKKTYWIMDWIKEIWNYASRRYYNYLIKLNLV